MSVFGDIEPEFSPTSIVINDVMPLAWQVLDAPPEDSELDKLDASNINTLKVISSLELAGIEPNDELGAVGQELARLELKVNVLLDMMSRLMTRDQMLPESIPVWLSGEEISWTAPESIASGAYLLVTLFMSPAYPQPIVLPAITSESVVEDDQFLINARFVDMILAVREELDKQIFRFHRRHIATVRRYHGF